MKGELFILREVLSFHTHGSVSATPWAPSAPQLSPNQPRRNCGAIPVQTGPIWLYLEEQDTGKQRHPCRWQRSPLCTCGCTETPSQSDTTELARLKSAHPCGSHVGRPPSVREPFVKPVHTAGSPTTERLLAHETTQLHSSTLSMHTSTHRALNQSLVLNMEKARRQAVFLTQHHLAGKGTFIRYL